MIITKRKPTKSATLTIAPLQPYQEHRLLLQHLSQVQAAALWPHPSPIGHLQTPITLAHGAMMLTLFAG